MFTGLLIGLIRGGVFAAVVLALVSLLSDVPGAKPPVADGGAASPSAPAVDDQLVTDGAMVPETAETRPASDAPTTPAEEGSNFSLLGEEVTTPAQRPTPSIETSAMAPPPQFDETAPSPNLAAEESLRSPTPAAPATPTPETGLVVDTASTPDPAAIAPAPATPAIEEFAVSVVRDAEKPALSILLLDDPEAVLGAGALSAFGHVLTIGIDPRSAAARERMAMFRAAGYEIVFVGGVPGRDEVDTIPNLLNQYRINLPETVAMLDGTGVGFGGDRTIMRAVADGLAHSGHGLISFGEAGQEAISIAAEADVPGQVIFRDLDGNGQKAAIIRRFLDQAASVAGRRDGVIVMGRMRPETISALLIWGQQSRAEAVQMVPVSTQLRAQKPD